MLTPSIFRRSFVDNFFDDAFHDMFQEILDTSSERPRVGGVMSTDVQDLGEYYQMEVELPGYEKEDLKVDLKKGYLTISAEHKEENDQKDKDGKFICKERYMGRCQRSFYVGENVTQKDIRAAFENGVLKVAIPKKDIQEVEEKQYITIE